MDERVRVVRKVNGLSEIRVYTSDLDDMGRDQFYTELAARGFGPDQLGEPRTMRSHPAEVRIPIRKESE
jgi:hypothetical protein